MQELLQLSAKERATYFEQAGAESMTIKNPILLEKDFWVCWVLDIIFSTPELSDQVVFKGGTSLSKCFGIIERFSEDIDLTLSKEFVGLDVEETPLNRKQIDKRNNHLKQNVIEKISTKIKPLLDLEFKKRLSNFSDDTWTLLPDEKDKQTLIFSYPLSLSDSNDYIKSSVKLELGAQGSLNPNEIKCITPYVYQLLPKAFENTPKIKVNALSAKRTFWEKATLLHAEYHRDITKPTPQRLFRHYYDISMLNKKNYATEALEDITLLEDVVSNTKINFPRKWANYDMAKIGSLQLFPNKNFITALKEDSKKMSDMFFGELPDFDEVMENVRELEKRINNSN